MPSPVSPYIRMEKFYPLGEDLGGALSPLIPLRGLESAHARQRSSKLDAALAYSQISPFFFPLWSVEFIPWKVSGQLMVLESVL